MQVSAGAVPRSVVLLILISRFLTGSAIFRAVGRGSVPVARIRVPRSFDSVRQDRRPDGRGDRVKTAFFASPLTSGDAVIMVGTSHGVRTLRLAGLPGGCCPAPAGRERQL